MTYEAFRFQIRRQRTPLPSALILGLAASTGLLNALPAFGDTPSASPGIALSTSGPDTNGQVAVTATLVTNGDSVAATQNTILFDNTILSLPTTSSHVAQGCHINPAIGLTPNGQDCSNDVSVGPCKNLLTAVHQCGTDPEPLGCPEGAGSNLSALNTLITGLSPINVNVIPDAALYTCTFTLTDAAAWPATIDNTRLVISDPSGQALCGQWDQDPCGGTVAPPLFPTFTPPPLPPTATLGPSFTPTPLSGIPEINIGEGWVGQDNTALVPIVLGGNGATVGGTENVIVFDNRILQLATSASGSASGCVINPAIGLMPQGQDCSSDTSVGPCKNLSTAVHVCGTTPEPLGCPEGATADFTAVVALVAANAAPNTNAIPDGVLYTCSFAVTNLGALPTTLQNLGVVAADPNGNKLCGGDSPCGGMPGVIVESPTTPSSDVCASGSDCASGNCVDHVCCNVPSCPDGLSCNIPGFAGVCHAHLDQNCGTDADCVSGVCSPSHLCAPPATATPAATPTAGAPGVIDVSGPPGADVPPAAGNTGGGCELADPAPRRMPWVLLASALVVSALRYRAGRRQRQQ